MRLERRVPELRKCFCREVGGLERKEFPHGQRKHPGIGVRSWGWGRCVEAGAGDAQEHWGEQVSQREGTEPGRARVSLLVEPQHPDLLRTVGCCLARDKDTWLCHTPGFLLCG